MCLFNVCLELAHILPVDLRIDGLTLLGDFGVRCGRESKEARNARVSPGKDGEKGPKKKGISD